MADVTLATLAARRTALAKEAEDYTWKVHGNPARSRAQIESALVQAQRDLCEALRQACRELDRYHAINQEWGEPHWVKMAEVEALLDRALEARDDA